MIRIVFCLMAFPALCAAQTFRGNHDSITFIGEFNNNPATYASGISGDGLTVIGRGAPGSSQPGWKWTASSGFSAIPGMGSPAGISYDGSVIVGASLTSNSGLIITPTGSVLLPYRQPSAVSDDGTVVAGSGGYGTPQAGFVWTSQTGAVTMSGPYGNNCSPHAMNGNGSLIVGQAYDSSLPVLGVYGFEWTAATGANSLLKGVDNGSDASANAISNDGSVVVGDADLDGNGVPAIWTAANGWQTVATTGGRGSLNGLTPDGRLAIGNNEDLNKGYLWDPVNGLRYIQDVLASDGINLNGYQISYVEAESDNGSVLTGTATTSSGAIVSWVATIPVPEPGTLGAGLFALMMMTHRRKKQGVIDRGPSSNEKLTTFSCCR